MTVDELPPDDRSRIERTFQALEARGIAPVFVPDRAAALEEVLGRLTRGALVSHGTSTTLLEIGLVDWLRDPATGVRYGNDEWRKENDAAKRGRLRAQITTDSDVFLGSVQAVCETGQVLGTDMTGSRQMGYVYGPQKVVWVAGINKLVADLEAALRRAREVALPLEDARVRREGGPGSRIGKIVIYEWQHPGRTSLVLVGEDLGF